jgi:hypothetical protein
MRTTLIPLAKLSRTSNVKGESHFGGQGFTYRIKEKGGKVDIKAMRYLVVFLMVSMLGLVGCSDSSQCAATVADLTATLSALAAVEAVEDNVSTNTLMLPGETYTITGTGSKILMRRTLPSVSTTNAITADSTHSFTLTSPASAFSALVGVMRIDITFHVQTPNPLAEFSAPGHSSGWMAAYLVKDVTNAATLVSALNESGSGMHFDLPCDKSACVGACTCSCYRWDFTANNWTTTGVTSTDNGSTLTCTSFYPKAYVDVFAVEPSAAAAAVTTCGN